MQIEEKWLKTWICLSYILFHFGRTLAARPRFDVSTDMGMVLVPADAEVDTAIFRLRATDQDADFPLVFEIIATTSPIVKVENLPCTLYNKVCQANVILTRRLVAGRLHDFVVRVRDSKGDVNSMQATISVTNATTPRDKIFPHLPSLIMVPEDTKPEKELDYLLVESNPWSGKPVYIELWQPKELFKIRQRQMGSRTKGIITLIGDLDFETQSMYTLTMYATDPYTEPGKDTRNIAGLHVVVVVQDVQDVPPVFTLAPPLTKLNNTVKPGEVILRVHAEDGDKGVPREVTYGLISEGNPFTPFFNVSETTGEIILAKPLEELTQITHVGAPIVLKIVAEEIRSSRDEPPAQASVVELGLLLGEPGNSPPYFENDNYVAWIDENSDPGTVVTFTDAYTTTVRDEDIGKAGVFSLILENNNGTFEISPAVAERVANFIITVRDSSLIDYEKFRSLRFKIRAQEVGPATNLSATVPVTIFLRDVNDNAPVFDMQVYEVTLSENPNAGTRVVQVHATDIDAGIFGKIQYTKIVGDGSEAFELNPDTGAITISMGSELDREQASRLELTVEAKDEEGRGMRGSATLIINLLDVNDNPPIFDRGTYEFLLNNDLTNFSMPAIVKAFDADAEPPNNVIRYEIVHGNYENKFQLDEVSGELTLREAISATKTRKARNADSPNQKLRKQFRKSNIESLDELAINATNATNPNVTSDNSSLTTETPFRDFHLINNLTDVDLDAQNQSRRRRAEDTPLFVITVRAYDLGVPHLSSVTQIRIMRPMSELARIVTFVMPGENPDPTKTAETLATITGSRVIIQEIKPYEPGASSDIGKRSVVVARVEQGLPGTVVDVDKIREILAANGFGVISGMDNVGSDNLPRPSVDTTPSNSDFGQARNKNASNNVALTNEEVVVYKTENKLLTWLLILLGLLLLAALITLITCCICPSCPFYMEPRKRRIHSTETLVVRADGRPKRHLRRKPIKIVDKSYHNGRKEAWSADPERQQWQFNRRNTKNLGIASLPGDIAPNHHHHNNHYSTSLRGGGGDDRIYMEDVEMGQRHISYEQQQAEMDSLRRHELERGSDAALRDEALAARQERIRESHYYRDGNAEVMRLVTRGPITEEDHKNFNRVNNIYHVNGKDILMQRFIEDQKLRRNQEMREGYNDGDLDRSMESHRRANEPAEILILPERLEFQQQPSYGLRQQKQEQMFKIAERDYKYQGFKEVVDRGVAPRVTLREAEAMLMGETSRSGEETARNPPGGAYSMRDAELVRQNALLTRLLLEKEAAGHLNVPVVDSSSFLETQSLPGHAAIATQTDRTTSTQTEFFVGRSRSDNEESEEAPRSRRKSTKLKGRQETREEDSMKRMSKTIWVRTPIPEENRVHSGTKVIEVMESSRKISMSPDEPDSIEDEPKLMSKKVKAVMGGDDSTTPSPESKDKQMPMQAKIKPRKPPRKFVEPSFRVLEREISSIHQKIRHFGDKKLSLGSSKTKDESSRGSMKKDSEDDSAATYDVSKKFEVTVKRTKKSESRETSPTKVSIEQRMSKTSETKSMTCGGGKHPTTSSSDLEDFGNSNGCSSDVVTKVPTRGRSELRRQARFEQHSSSEKFKFSSSSPERKADPNMSTSKDSGGSRQQQKPTPEVAKRASEKKGQLQSQKPIKRPIETRKKMPAVKAKTEEEKRMSRRDQHLMEKARSQKLMPSPASLSPTKSKEVSITQEPKSEVVEPIRETAKVSIDLDKLAQDVRGVVEKEISSLTQAAKEALTSDKRDEKATTSPSKQRRLQHQQHVDKYGMSKSLDSKKDLVSKQQKSNGSAPLAKVQSDDAISFIVIENNKTLGAAKHEERDKPPKRLEKSKVVSSSSRSDEEWRRRRSGSSDANVVTNKSKETFGKLSGGESSSVDAVITDFRKSVSEDVEEMIDRAKAIEKSASNKVDDAVGAVDDKVRETEKTISKEIGEAERIVSDRIDETKRSLTTEMVETKNIMSDKIDEAKKSLSCEIDKTKESLAAEMNETKNIVSEKIKETKRSLSGEICETKKSISDQLDDAKKSLSEEIDETKKTLSDTVEGTETKVTEKLEETKDTVIDTIDENKKDLSGEINETKKSITDRLDEARKSLSEEIDETKKVISDKVEKTEEIATERLEESKEAVIEKIEETKKHMVIEPRVDEFLEKKDDAHVSSSKEGEIVFTYSVETSNDLLKSANEGKQEIETKEEPKQSNLRSDALKFMSKCLPRKMRDSQNSSVEEVVGASKERDMTIETETTGDSTRYTRQVRERETITLIRSPSPRDAEKTDKMKEKEESPQDKEQVDKTEPSDSGEISEKREEKKSADSEIKSTIISTGAKEEDQTKILPEKPTFEITNAIGDERDEHASDTDDDESSTASDVSNRTALRATLPYGTPRHSISEAEGEEDKKTDEKTSRQKWSSKGEAVLKVEVPKAPTLSEKIEVAPIGDEGESQASSSHQKKPEKEKPSDETTLPKSKPVVVAVKRKEHSKTDHSTTTSTHHHQQQQHSETRKSTSPRREKIEEHRSSSSSTKTTEQRKVEIRSKHLKLQVSHHSSRSKSPSSKEPSPMREFAKDDGTPTPSTATAMSSPRIIDYGRDPEIANARSRYMAWYQQKRAEMERKRRERKEAEEELLRRGGVRKPAARKRTKAADGDKQDNEAKGSKERADATQASAGRGGHRISRLRIRPLVNVESEQLKAIVRQGRKLRKAEGVKSAEDPPVQIFAPEKPPRDPLASVIQLQPRHHLTQHSEYKYEKSMPMALPFYLHPPPPPPHPSPEHFTQDDMTDSRRPDDDLDSGIAVSMQGGTRLRHQQLLEKKSVFDIAYSEAAPTQLRSDSSTPPS